MAKPQGRFGGACGIRLFLLFALQQFPCQQAQEILLRTKPIQGRHGGIVMLLCQRTCPVQAVEGDKGRFVVIGIAADGLAREAADIASSATSADMQASTEKSQQAIESFSKAKTALQNAEQLFPQLDLSAYMSYIDKRLEAQGYAIESNDALIDRDTQAATEHNDAYNNAERQAGELAEKLPEDPDELVVEAFDSKTASSREMYENARSQAQSADAFIRDYLGTFNK